MKNRKLCVAVMGVGSALFAWQTPSANAGSIVLGQSGWKATWADVYDPIVRLQVNCLKSDRVELTKCVNFDYQPGPAGFIDPVVIVFQQTSLQAVANLSIRSETLLNNTGHAWDGFRMTLLGGATFDAGSLAGFNTTPMAIKSLAPGDTILNLSGGVVPIGGVFTPGVGAGELVMNTASIPGGAMKAFSLKEQPLPAPTIPLPAAAWTGLSGLIGLSISAARKRRAAKA